MTSLNTHRLSLRQANGSYSKPVGNLSQILLHEATTCLGIFPFTLDGNPAQQKKKFFTLGVSSWDFTDSTYM